jgi:AbiV family abortive infection protein
MSAPDLTIQDVRLLAPAAARNARDLHVDAEILLEHQRWSRAHALAVLAGEEASKAYACVAALASGASAVPRHDLERHNRKLLLARTVTNLVIPLAEWSEVLLTSAPPTPTELVEMARQDNEAKKRGFYVDMNLDGSLQQPSEIGEADAKNAIAAVSDLVRWVSSFTSDKGLRVINSARTYPAREPD